MAALASNKDAKHESHGSTISAAANASWQAWLAWEIPRLAWVLMFQVLGAGGIREKLRADFIEPAKTQKR